MRYLWDVYFASFVFAVSSLRQLIFYFSFKKNFYLICCLNLQKKKNKLWNNLSDLMNEGEVVNVYYIGD